MTAGAACPVDSWAVLSMWRWAPEPQEQGKVLLTLDLGKFSESEIFVLLDNFVIFLTSFLVLGSGAPVGSFS